MTINSALKWMSRSEDEQWLSITNPFRGVKRFDPRGGSGESVVMALIPSRHRRMMSQAASSHSLLVFPGNRRTSARIPAEQGTVAQRTLFT